MTRSRNKEISFAERERRVWNATRKYARGQMSAEDFEKAERENTPNYSDAIAGLSDSYAEQSSDETGRAQFR
jgi:hypothetical protein